MRIISALAMSALGLSIWGGCNAVNNAIDCNTICSRYRDCYDANYDVGACESRCRDQANQNANYQSQIDDCYDCIGGQSCASATFDCSLQCSNVVP